MYQFRIQDIKSKFINQIAIYDLTTNASEGRLSDGEIAGIVIGVLAGVLLIALCVILIIRSELFTFIILAFKYLFRQKNIKKAKIQRQERRRQREEQ